MEKGEGGLRGIDIGRGQGGEREKRGVIKKEIRGRVGGERFGGKQ